MNCRTYELYDENEYFLKYLSIHPILIYSLKDVDIKKKELQLYLLDEFNKEIITYDKLCDKYKIVMEQEKQGRTALETIKYNHRQIEELMFKSHESNMASIYELITKNKN